MLGLRGEHVTTCEEEIRSIVRGSRNKEEEREVHYLGLPEKDLLEVDQRLLTPHPHLTQLFHEISPRQGEHQKPRSWNRLVLGGPRVRRTSENEELRVGN